jgi:hypothetical protein
MSSRWQTAKKSRPCPVCQHTDWCKVSPDGAMAWCGREGAGALKASKGGWLHRLGSARVLEGAPSWAPRPRSPQPTVCARPSIDYAGLARQWSANVDPTAAKLLADRLHLNVSSLRRLGLGWAPGDEIRATGTQCRGRGCWSFPMTDAAGEIVGIRLRSLDGFKYSLAGSDGQGLFTPKGLDVAGGLLLGPEGPTSAAALLGVRLPAVGRPNCRAGVENLRRLIRRLGPFAFVVIGDNDEPDKLGRRAGQDSAPDVARQLRGACPLVTWMLPPEGLKDTRVWLTEWLGRYGPGAIAGIRRSIENVVGVGPTAGKEAVA